MREQQRRVAQKLAFARWHLGWAESVAGNRAQVDALLESTVLHLVGAYRAFLDEIMQDTHVQGQLAEAPSCAIDLAHAYTGPYLPPSLAECNSLEQQDSWLSQLLAWHTWVARTTARLGAPSALLSSDQAILNAQQLAAYADEFEALIDRLRGDMLEY